MIKTDTSNRLCSSSQAMLCATSYLWQRKAPGHIESATSPACEWCWCPKQQVVLQRARGTIVPLTLIARENTHSQLTHDADLMLPKACHSLEMLHIPTLLTMCQAWGGSFGDIRRHPKLATLTCRPTIATRLRCFTLTRTLEMLMVDVKHLKSVASFGSMWSISSQECGKLRAT